MPSPAPPLPVAPGAQIQPGRALGSPVPASSPSVLPRRPAPGRLGSSFSVEAILARPEPRAPAAHPPAPWAWPWARPAARLPACLSPGVSPLCPRVCGPQGLDLTGLELGPSLELRSPPAWAPTEDLQDVERHPKRVRTVFNLRQLGELESTFSKQHNLVGEGRAQLAARLQLTENQVRIWFQNRRVKYQKQQKLKPPEVSPALPATSEEPSSSSDSSVPGEGGETGAGS